MSNERRDNQPELAEGSPLTGMRVLRPIQAAIERLHTVGTSRDKARNRQFFFDQYISILLLYFFNSSITSLHALQNAGGWAKVRTKLGVKSVSLGSFSEAQGLFNADYLEPIVRELAEKALPLSTTAEAEALQGLTAVDGSFLDALPRMTWALWHQNPPDHQAKLHLHFDVLKGVPRQASITPAACSEPAELKQTLEKGRLYVLDRGYASYQLFADILQAGSSFVARVKDTTTYSNSQERALDEKARQAGVIRDFITDRLGTDHRLDLLKRPIRLVIVRVPKRDGTGTTDLWLATDRFDLAADLVALAYRYRWSIELFFRWLKCILGARHLIAQSQNGVRLQMYAALIVSLLIILRTGRKANKRTFETVQFYLLGWVSDEEFEEHIKKLQALDAQKIKKNA